jgi:SAM-dependent methyltransferase
MHASLQTMIIRLLDLSAPCALLDIGCGTGDLLQEVARQAQPGSRLLGIDASAAAIAAASAQAPALAFNVHKFVDTLPLPSATFDVAISVNLLECIVDKAAFLRELARVLKPGGTLICAHWDWDTQVYASDEPAALRWLVHAYADWQQGWMDACDGLMGRKLWGVFQRSGLFTGRVEVSTLVETRYAPGQQGYDRLQDLAALAAQGIVDGDMFARFRHEMESLNAQGAYFYSINCYLYIGQTQG